MAASAWASGVARRSSRPDASVATRPLASAPERQYRSAASERMSQPRTPEEFRASLYSRKHTLRQLKVKLQGLAPTDRADALLGVFTDRTRPETAFADQELAGQLLVDLVPACSRDLDEVLLATASTWNLSVEQLPVYLNQVFGREAVVQAATRLATAFPGEAQEARALQTVRWWLGGKST